MDRLTEEHVRRNRQSQSGWALFADHRQQVTRLLDDAAPDVPQPDVCVLGAGNCNDLDLLRVTGRFGEVHLIDLDGEAVRNGVERQLGQPGGVSVHGGVDVTGCQRQLADLPADSSAGDAAIDDVLRHALARSDLGLGRQFDVVVSSGLLTQLISSVDLGMGAQHPRFLDVVQAVRSRHLRLLLELTRPGGTALMIAEVVSSDSYPQLAETPEARLPEVLSRLIQGRNFFTGTNPAAIASFLQTDPQCAADLDGFTFVKPWLWQFFERTYAVYAIRMQKRAVG